MNHKPAPPSSAPGAGSRPSERPIADDRLPLPHEREGDPGYANQAPKGVVKQAHRDLDAGQVDTDLHNQGGLDQSHRDALLRGEAAAQSPARQGGRPAAGPSGSPGPEEDA